MSIRLERFSCALWSRAQDGRRAHLERRGELFGFLGSNGAGKTTTIKILRGLLLPNAGLSSTPGYGAVQIAATPRLWRLEGLP